MLISEFQVIRRPIITEKGLGVKETQHTVVFEVAPAATKTQIKERCRRFSRSRWPEYARPFITASFAAAGAPKGIVATGRRPT